MKITRTPPALVLSFLILAAVFASAPSGLTQEGEDGENSVRERKYFNALLFGWSGDGNDDYSYVAPFYYHGRDRRKDSSLTLVFPLLTGAFRTPEDPRFRMRTTACLPLLAAWGRLDKEVLSASGFASPYLAAGSLGFESDGLEARRSGASLLPWVPFLDDTLRFDLYGRSSGASKGGEFRNRDYFTMPGLDIGLYDTRSVGIEADTSYLNVWGISLFRHGIDLPNRGFRPWLRESESFDVFSRWWRWPCKGPVPGNGRFARIRDIIADSRSGMPVEYKGLLDPMITFAQRGEGIHSLGFEPFFHYGADEGTSIPFLLTSFTSDGIRLGGPAVRHLFPIIHANAEGTRWDFLLNYGTVYAFDDYSAVDLKLLFNYQHREDRGTAWGFLPFFFGRYPGRELNPGARFVQLDKHAVGYWNMGDRRGFEILYPFVFSWNRSEDGCRSSELDVGPFGLLFSRESDSEGRLEHSSLWSLLYSYETDRERTALDLGPFGFLLRTRSQDETFDMRILWVFGYENGPGLTEIDFIGIPLIRKETRTLHKNHAPD